MAEKLQIVEALAESGTRYKETALAMPYILIEDSIKHLNVVHGLRGKEVEGFIDEQGHYKKYKTAWDPDGAQTLKARTLETFHLQYESEFDPEPIMKTVFSKPIDKIPLLTQDMVKKIAIAKMMAISENLNPNIWTGERDEESDDALSNFDGFATIIRKERAAGNISLAAGNLVQLGGINEYNAGVKLQMVWKRRNKKIKKADMFIEDSILTMYQDWYRNQNYNNANTNTDGQQYYLIGTEKKCRLVSCTGMEGMGYVILTDGKQNMKVGIDGIGTGENATGNFKLFNPGNPKVVALFTDCWMGVNFTRIEKEFLMTASYNIHDEAVYATVDPEESTITCDVNETKTLEITFQGYNVTSSVNVTVDGTGLTSDTSVITASDANADGGKKVTLTYAPLAAAEGKGTVRFTSATDDIDLTVQLNLVAEA